MQQITIDQVPEIVDQVVIKLREPVMFWGGPGFGKTQVIHQEVAKPRPMPSWVTDYPSLDAANWKPEGILVDFRVALRDSVDARGIPEVRDGQTYWARPSDLPFKGNPQYPNDRLIGLFVDEANAGSQAMFTIAMQLVNERKVGEHELMDNVVIICAGNREGDKGVANRMPTTMSNRLTHYEVIPTVDAMVAYAQEQGWPQEFTAFLHFRKNLLTTFDEAVKSNQKAFATPRTWEKAMKYYASKTMSERVKIASMAGAVGDGPAAEFEGFTKVYQQIVGQIPAILKDPKKASVPEEASMLYALSVCISGNMDKGNVGTYHTYLTRLPPEFAVLAWNLALKRDNKLFEVPEFIKFSQQYKAIF